MLHLLDHEPLLPRLLEGGADLEALDHRGRTPLFVAVNDAGSPTLVRDLLAAGARIDVEDDQGLSLGDLIDRYKRRDLRFLKKRVETEYPDLGSGWWSDEDDESDAEGEDQ
ncbi:hypothetical protein ACZ90_49630 [Streptomyces albus subsp. albus]|nr:hypothetical protein ACZ90_49630 [Streptomyces albus subsp. albus]